LKPIHIIRVILLTDRHSDSIRHRIISRLW